MPIRIPNLKTKKSIKQKCHTLLNNIFRFLSIFFFEQNIEVGKTFPVNVNWEKLGESEENRDIFPRFPRRLLALFILWSIKSTN